MKLANAMLLVLVLVLAASAQGASITSAFDNFRYDYTLTPEAGEDIRAFHVYTSLSECDVTHYYDVEMPAGWFFDTVPLDDKCVLTFWTDGAPLAADVTTPFGFTHYCAPCCHSWYVSEPGTSDPNVAPVDDDSQHSEACNIPPEFGDECGGVGLIMAPIFPQGIPNDAPSWGGLKATYR